jgi:hypothetical protein
MHWRLPVNGEGAGEMIEDLLNISGGDGDFIPGGIAARPDATEIDHLLEVWSQEPVR